MPQVTEVLKAIDCGDLGAADHLLPLVYDELRKLAAARLAKESPGQPHSATSLVHEAYLRLVGDCQGDKSSWDGKGHFFAAAAEAMRRILVERARRKASVKHGGKFRRLDLDDRLHVEEERAEELLALDEVLGELEQYDAQAAQIVKLRYFAGMSHSEAAAALGITRRAGDRVRTLAKAWLYERLSAD